MKDYALELVSEKSSNEEKLNILREYLQAYILRFCHDYALFRNVAFLGGTALRFLHSLPRYSEDLDFSLVNRDGYTFAPFLKKLKQELELAGYEIDLSYKDDKIVHSASINFVSLLHEARISAHKNQKMSVKFEIDTNPPTGAVVETQLVNKFFPIAFTTYDLASLFAGKIHAILSRRYTKGRDYFDLGWYLSRWKNLEPNAQLLRAALEQTGNIGLLESEKNWRQALATKLHQVNWPTVVADVTPFLERKSDLDVLNKHNILKLLQVD